MNRDRRSNVERVPDGDFAYDELPVENEQATVRAVWNERVAERIAATDFEAEFIAQGRAWTDVDANGKPIRRTPTESGDIDLPKR